MARISHLPRILERHHDALLTEWIGEQRGVSSRSGQINDAELREHCTEFLRLLRQG